MDLPLQYPIIPLLQGADLLDLQLLGSEPLRTYVPVADLVDGDRVNISWRGRSASGKVIDSTASIPFYSSEVDPITGGFPVPFSNAFILEHDQGEAFYSYFVEKPEGTSEESLRLSLRIGVRALKAPVAQVMEAHDGWLDDQLNTYTVAVMPYGAMAVGDRITLSVQGYEGDYQPAPWVDTLTLRQSDPGSVLLWNLPPNYVSNVAGGYLDISYEILYGTPSSVATLSAQQRLLLGTPASPSPLLSPARIKGHDSPYLNPDAFPDGVVMVIDLYEGAQAGDDLALYWNATSSIRSTRKTVHLDASNIDSGRLEIAVEQAWLAANHGQGVTVIYQYSRLLRNGLSGELRLQIREPLNLPALTVVGAVLQSDGSYEHKASLLSRGVRVVIPAEANYGPNDRVTLFWAGEGSGFYSTTEPIAPGSREYLVPPEHVPANMNHRLQVYYRVEQDEQVQDSSGYELYLKGLAPTDVRAVGCDQATDGTATLRMSNVPTTGATFTQPAWVYKASGNLISMRLEGIDASNPNGPRLTVDLALDEPVGDNASAGFTATLPKDELGKLQRNTVFTVSVAVKFEAGLAPIEFLTLRLTLLD